MSTRIDWSQLWYPGPTRVFTPEEMATAGADRPSRTLQAVVLLNVALIGFVVLLMVPAAQAPRALGLLVAITVIGGGAARWLWQRPWRGPLCLASMVVAGLALLLAVGLRWRVPEREERVMLGLVLAVGTSSLALMLWFLVVWRAQQIESRLAAQAEREQAIEMARRLAAAQIEPHFLFNTLASLQHWVDTRDERASPLLVALTGYLRATLPMFKRPTQPLADELEAVERYLQVMQARLGARLAWSIEVPSALAQRPLPSGVLLTLVENAVQHGVEPSLAGGRVQIVACEEGTDTLIDVIDDGAGLAAGATDGVGLANVRQRLALVAGAGASLTLSGAPGAGCVARLVLPRTRPAAPPSSTAPAAHTP